VSFVVTYITVYIPVVLNKPVILDCYISLLQRFFILSSLLIPFEIMDTLLPKINSARKELAATHMTDYILRYMHGQTDVKQITNILNSLSVDILDRLFSKANTYPHSSVPGWIVSCHKAPEILKRRTQNELADIMCRAMQYTIPVKVFEMALNAVPDAAAKKALIKEFFWRGAKLRIVDSIDFIADDEVFSELILEAAELSDHTIYYALISRCFGRPRERTVLRPALQKIIERGGFKPSRSEKSFSHEMDIETLKLLLSMGETGVRFSPTYLKLGTITPPKPAEQLQVKDISKWLLESSENWQKISEVVEIAQETILC
jgi:hypothetical protein